MLAGGASRGGCHGISGGSMVCATAAHSALTVPRFRLPVKAPPCEPVRPVGLSMLQHTPDLCPSYEVQACWESVSQRRFGRGGEGVIEICSNHFGPHAILDLFPQLIRNPLYLPQVFFLLVWIPISTSISFSICNSNSVSKSTTFVISSLSPSHVL